MNTGDRMPYYLGCPVFASPHWIGSVFTANVRRADWLRQYSQAFNTVEGNSTFYGLPSRETVLRWAAESAPGFRFALKFPRIISHEKELRGADWELRRFLQVLELLRENDRLGPSFLQLGPRFSSARFADLREFLARLSKEFPYAVEVRHADYFDQGPHEQRLDALLREHHIDRVIFDSRPLFSQPPTDDSETESQRRKPRSPIRTTVTGRHPMLRIVGRNNTPAALPWVREWVPIVAGWIRAGRVPYVFTHSPNDAFAPEFARLFHGELRKELPELADLPAWLGEAANVPQRGVQKMLF